VDSVRNPKLYTHLVYASGNFGKSSLSSFVELFALFYFTDILGIPAAIAGTILFLSLAWDGITDPLMGMAADRLREKLPTVRLYFLLGAPLTAMAFVAMFQASDVPPQHRILYIFCILVMFRLAYTVVDVPHNSMLAFLSRDSRDRTNIASLRIFFSSLGKLLVTLGATLVFDRDFLDSFEERFSTASMVLAFIYLAVMSLCLSSIWNTEIRTIRSDAAPLQIRDILKSMASNFHLMIVFALTMVTSLTTPIIGIALIYYAKYALNNERLGAVALVIMSISQAVSLIFWSKFSNRLRYKKHAAQLANAFLAAAMVFGLAVMHSSATFYMTAMVAGMAIGGIFMLNWSMLPDALDFSPNLSSSRYNFSVFGLYTLTNKIFIGLSQGLVGLTLAAYGYQPDSIEVGAHIGAITSTLLSFPLMGTIACIALLSRHTQPQGHAP
jgi:GPH family glycoside/pentoside/hexuronide:cation symporter